MRGLLGGPASRWVAGRPAPTPGPRRRGQRALSGMLGEGIAYQSVSIPRPVSTMPSRNGAPDPAPDPIDPFFRPARDGAPGACDRSGRRSSAGGRLGPHRAEIIRRDLPARRLAARRLATRPQLARLAYRTRADGAGTPARSCRRPLVAPAGAQLASARPELGAPRRRKATHRSLSRTLLARAQSQLAYTRTFVVADVDARGSGRFIFVRQEFLLAQPRSAAGAQ